MEDPNVEEINIEFIKPYGDANMFGFSVDDFAFGLGGSFGIFNAMFEINFTELGEYFVQSYEATMIYLNTLLYEWQHPENGVPSEAYEE